MTSKTDLSRLTHEQAQRRAADLRVTDYLIDLDLTDGDGGPAVERFRSRCLVRFGATAASSFIDAMPAELSQVRLNGRPVEPVVSGGRIELTDLQPENELVVEGWFPLADEHQGMQRSVDPADGEVYFSTMMFMAGAQKVFACFDQPDLKSHFTFTVTAPAAWEVISNGAVEQIQPAPGDARRWSFARTAPMPSYVTAVLAGPYHRVAGTVPGPAGDIDLGIVYPRSAEGKVLVQDCLRWTRAGFDFFHQMFGYPYPYGKYDQIFGLQPGMWAMENAGAVTFGNGFVFPSAPTSVEREILAVTLLHELSHMWFGNLVTTRWWDDSWLNEAFATYASYLSASEVTEFTTAWTSFAHDDKGSALAADQRPSTHPISAVVPDLPTALSNFDDITYEKGASVLRQLAAFVGRPAFTAGLRSYFAENAFGNSTLNGLLDHLHRASGLDLQAWAAEWLQRAGVSRLDPVLSATDGTIRSFALRQSDSLSGAARRHRTTVGLYDGIAELACVARVEVDVDGPLTEVPALVGTRVPALILVNDTDVTFARVGFDDRSIATLVGRIGELTDPLAGSVAWAALWDSVRGGEVVAADYVRAAIAGTSGIGEPTVLEGVLDNVGRALGHYLPPSTGRSLAADLVGHLRQRAADPAQDPELRTVWLRALLHQAPGTDLAGLALELYRGDHRIDGLSLDFDSRWRALIALATHGQVTAEDIDAEYAKDPNSTSLHHGARARAALPDARSKADAWQSVTSRGGQVSLKYAAARGFWQQHQEELLLGYVDRYFADADRLWAFDNGGEHARAAAGGLFPTLVHPEVVTLGERWLAGDHAPMLRRIVLDGLDEVRRGLRLRAAG